MPLYFNLVWDGQGTTRNEKAGESGVNYNYVDVRGQAQTSIIYRGSKPKTLDEARAEARNSWEDYEDAVNNHMVYGTENGDDRRVIDDKPLDAPMSGQTQAKVL